MIFFRSVKCASVHGAWIAAASLAVATATSCGGSIRDEPGPAGSTGPGGGGATGAGGGTGTGESTATTGSSSTSETGSTSGTGSTSVGAGGAASAGTGAAAGTGGSTITGGTGGSAMTGTGGAGGGTGHFEGSYDLVFRNVVVMGRGGSNPPRPPPSEGMSARIDLRRIGTAYEALVTPRWGMAASFTVTENLSELKLTGKASIRTGGNFVMMTDTWSDLRLGIDPTTGALSGAVQASGEEEIVTGDVGSAADIASGGNVVRDATAPEVRAELDSLVLPPGQRFPWEWVRVRAAEGVGAGEMKAGVSLVRTAPDSSAPMPVIDWAIGPTDTTFWGGASMLEGRAKSWDELGGLPVEVRLGGASVVDVTGHTMANDYSAGFTFLDLNLPVDGDVLEPGSPIPAAQWGDVAVRGVTGADPVCESGACVVIGPFQNGQCPIGRHGIAGRLRAPRASAATTDAGGSPAGKVRVRYRVLAAATAGSPMPTFSAPPFSIDVAVPGEYAQSTDVAPPTLHDLGADAGEFRYASDFLDAVAPSPDAARPGVELGFAIYAGVPYTITCPSGGLPWPVMKTEVVIDKIAVQP